MPYKDPQSPQARANAVVRAMNYRKRHPEECREREGDWRRSVQGKEKQESNRLTYEYGLSLQDEKDIVAAQGGLCALCLRPLTPTKSSDWCLDHNHKTGKNRGVLHRKCNTAIGLLDDDVHLVKLAAEYLEKHS